MKKVTVVLTGLAMLAAAVVLAQPGPGNAPGQPGCGMHQPNGPMCGRQGMRMGQRGHMGMGRGMAMRGRMLEQLDLTEDQQAKLEKMRSDFQLLMIDQQAKVRKAQIQLRALMRNEKSAASAVEAQIDAVAKLRAETQKLHFRHRAEFQSILTDKQNATLKEMKMKGPGPRRGDMMDEDFEDEDETPHPDGIEG